MSFKVMGIVAGRHGGNSEALVKEALCAVREAGGEALLIDLFDYHIEHCTGCEGCTMQMGEVAQDPTKTCRGCILKDKDDVDRIITEMHTCQGVIIGCPTYDLTPSALYTKFAQRFLAYELSFLLEIGVVPVEERTWLGDPDDGICPRCHSSLIYRGVPDDPCKTAVGEMTNGRSGTVEGNALKGKSKNAMGEFDETCTCA